MESPAKLLSPDDPAPFRVLAGDPSSPFLLTADHAGCLIPRALGSLGLSTEDLGRHIAWDIGIAGLSEKLAQRLDAFLILQTYSRLVIDCNRPLDAPSSVATESEHTAIPGNQGLAPAALRARADEVFSPYHARIEQEILRREQLGVPTIFVAMHSFTPRFKGVDRPWHCGVLYNRDRRLAERLLLLLQGEGIPVGDNQPYFVSDETDYGVPTYGEKRGNIHVELEFRQDLLGSEQAQHDFARLFERLLREAAQPFV